MKKMIFMAVFLVFCAVLISGSAEAMSGAIYTTDVSCEKTNVNYYASKQDVYLNGGPVSPRSSGLPNGLYYVQVTEPDGTLLGYTASASVQVANGKISQCYNLWSILVKASDAEQGFDSTTNGGGVYKVWLSKNSAFPNNESKTDNFKVDGDGDNGDPEEIDTATLNVIKFYDANVNGINDDNQPITGWKAVVDGMSITDIVYTPATVVVEPGDYTVTEMLPLEVNWLPTTPDVVNITLAAGDDRTVEFGNVCLGPGGGRTIGFWSNKNGQAQMNDGNTMTPELALLSSYNLRNATGAHFDPNAYSGFRTWILDANATNMAYMLSAQLAAMVLNVEAGSTTSGFVSGNAFVYAPKLLDFDPRPAGLNDYGFITVNNLMTAANAELGINGNTRNIGHPARHYQEVLKNVLDAANNNLNFVQAVPCAFSFED